VCGKKRAKRKGWDRDEREGMGSKKVVAEVGAKEGVLKGRPRRGGSGGVGARGVGAEGRV
jgi:hypothetical protein